MNPLKKNNDDDKRRNQQKEIIRGIYGRWRSRLIKAKKTRKDLILALGKLKQEIAERAGTDGFAAAAIHQVEEQIAGMMAMNLTLKNSIKQFLSGEAMTNKKVKPKHVAFKTFEELRAIRWVSLYESIEGFKGFVLAGKGLVADCGTEQYIVGILENEIGVEHLKDMNPKQSDSGNDVGPLLGLTPDVDSEKHGSDEASSPSESSSNRIGSSGAGEQPDVSAN